MASPAAYLDLDWRKGCSNDELIVKLEALLKSLDDRNHVGIVNSASIGGTITTLRPATTSAPRMIQQRRHETTRRLATIGTKPEDYTSAEIYTVHLVHLIREMLARIFARKSLFQRGAFYQLSLEELTPKLNQAKLEQMLTDMSLTIKEHPSRLGIMKETTGQVYVPTGIHVDLKVVDNIFAYYDDNRALTRRRMVAGVSQIPGLVTDLSVTAKGQKIRYVVVSEHRNIKDVTTLMSGKHSIEGLEGVFLILTGGYADFATREFLHLLTALPEFGEVPIRWLSDCDPFGLDIANGIKWGTHHSAWASSIMVCPRLQVIGLTQDAYNEFLSKFPERRLAFDSRQRVMDDAEQKRVLDGYTQEAQRRKNVAFREGKARTQKDSSQARLAGMVKTGYYAENQREDAVAIKMLQYFLEGGASFSLNAVENIDAMGLAYVIRDAVAFDLGENYAEVPVVVRKAFETQSQMLSDEELQIRQQQLDMDVLEDPSVENADVDFDM